MKFCPLCREPLSSRPHDGRERLLCTAQACDYVFWNNPIPVVAAIVEHEGMVVLANNAAWPEDIYALITGFLEKDESPEDAVLREVHEELGLTAELRGFIGTYPFFRKNQLILAYHVRASGEIRLNEELRAYKRVSKEVLTYWDAGTGHALRDWLQQQGFAPQMHPLRR